MAEGLTAFIPVRGGSRGVPGKNLRIVAGKPLMDWTVEACLGAQCVHRVVVSTDDPGIGDHVAKRQARWSNRVEVHHRSAGSATDTASSESVMLEYVMGSEEAHIALVQATSPLLASSDVDRAWAMYRNPQWDSVLSVVRQTRFRWRADEGGAVSLDYEPVRRPRRQEFAGHLVENGAIYVTSRQALMRSGCRISGRIGLVEMAPNTYTEVDEPDDLEIVTALLRARRADARTMSAVGPLGPVRLVIADVDGVLTNNGMTYSTDGGEAKTYNARDGKGFELLRLADIRTAIITSERGSQIEARGKKLRVDALVMGSSDKLEDGKRICADLGVGLDETAFIGDDIQDLHLLQAVRLSACPADAVSLVRDCVDHVGRVNGGAGAFRELADLVLGATNAGHVVGSESPA